MNKANIKMDYKTLDSKTSGLKEHYHTGYEMIFITEGQSKFTIGDSIHKYEKNNILFLNDLEKHKMDLITTPYSRYMMIIDSERLNNTLKNPILLSLFRNRRNGLKNGFKIREKDLKFVKNTLDDLMTIYKDKSSFWEIEFPSKLSILLIFLYRNYKEYFPIIHINKTEERILEVQNYIDLNYRENLDLDQLVETFYISKYYLSHSFKEVTGYTIKQYILLKRISHAKNLLYFTEDSVTDIALNSGFNCQSSFIRTFKDKESTTPLQFRKYYRNNK